MLAMMISSYVLERSLVSPRLLIVIGLLFIAVSVFEMTGFTVNVTRSMITWTGFVQGLGLGLIFVPLSTLAFATLDSSLRTEGTSIFGLARTIGSSLGISIVVTALGVNLQQEHARLTEHITVFNPLLLKADSAALWDIHTPQGLALLESEVGRQALQLAYIDDFQLIMLMAIVAIPMALLLRDPARSAQ